MSPRPNQNKIAALSFNLGVYRSCVWHFVKENRDELLAVFTIILAFATIFLWVATRNLANEAAQASKVELRAYVAANHPKFGKNDPDSVTIVAENGGRTPAYKVTAWLNTYWRVGQFSLLPDGFKYPDQEQTGPFPVYQSVAVCTPERHSHSIFRSIPSTLGGFAITRPRYFSMGTSIMWTFSARTGKRGSVTNTFRSRRALAIAW